MAESIDQAIGRTYTVLGGFGVRLGERKVETTEWGRRSAARVVRYLLVSGPVSVHADVLFETFWPHLSAEGGRRSLQVAASLARRVLDRPGTASVIEVIGGMYRLHLEQDDILDSSRFDRMAVRALAVAPPDRALLSQARALWTGEPLVEDRYCDWATFWRERLLDRYVAVLTALSEAHQNVGDNVGASSAAAELLGIDALNEDAHRKLMVAYARAGRTGSVMRQYAECCRALTKIGGAPHPATSRLQARILAGNEV